MHYVQNQEFPSDPLLVHKQGIHNNDHNIALLLITICWAPFLSAQVQFYAVKETTAIQCNSFRLTPEAFFKQF